MSEETKSVRLPPDEQFLVSLQKGSFDECKKLQTSGFDINHKDRSGLSPIFSCTLPQHSKALRFLISSGANINMLGPQGNTALHYAVERGCMEIILILLLNGADPNIVNENKQKPEDLLPKIRPMIIALTADRQVYTNLSESFKKKLTIIFDEIDGEGSGILTLDKCAKFNRYMEEVSADVARKDAIDFLRDVGICRSGQVNLDEWLFSFAKLMSERGTEALDQFTEEFERIGKDRCKFVDFVPRD